ncbi:hypothetical protein BACCAP_02873 [Pseudoflavonifractor capillosus ATCC 29799]|uniref:Uncharacterized protein n=1 Tax=Pseudoflavonifractor capillosus ATCC 29799 TaxID=411467 RepID=A6NXC7_9FIRM|nr:hypothetical protein BACCAP_02873 [Pseudoflavonifractor capillosus ATCC 29799]
MATYTKPAVDIASSSVRFACPGPEKTGLSCWDSPV